MDHDCVAFHKLRLLNFNRRSDHCCRTSNEIKKYCDHEEKHSDLEVKRKLKTNCLCGKHSKCVKGTSQVFLHKKLRSPLTITICPSKKLSYDASKKPMNTTIVQKPGRSRDVEQKYSLYGVFSDGIKSKIHSLLKSKTGSKRKKHKAKHACKRNDIQVLFDAKKFKSQKRFRKRNAFGDCRKLDLLYNSESSGDVNELMYNKGVQTKTDIKKIYTNHSLTTCMCSKPVNYKLAEFPCDKMSKFVDLNNNSDRNCNCSLTKEIQCSRKNRKVSTTPTHFSICKIGAGDSATNRHSLDSKIQANCMKKHSGNGDTVPLKCTQRKRTNSFISVNFSNNRLVAIIKSVTKILLLSFAIIAWSPCIISVYIYWLITYPLRPHHIFAQSKFDECSKCKSCCQCGNAFWCTIFNSILRSLEKFGHVYNILVSSIKNQKHDNEDKISPLSSHSNVINRCLRHKHRKLHINANPREKYTLCCMQRRGWIIKPSREHRKQKHNLHKYCPIHINIDKSCEAAKSKKHPGVFRINTPGTLPSLKVSPYTQLSKKRHKENKHKKKYRTYSSKIVSTKSCPVLIKTSMSRTESKFTLIKKLSKLNTSVKCKTRGKSCTANFRSNSLLESIKNMETNTWKRNIGRSRHSRNVLYSTQTYSPFINHIYGQKYKAAFLNKHQYQGCSLFKRKTGPTPCSCKHRLILPHSKRCSYYPKISFAMPSKQKKRTKSEFQLLSKDSFRKFKHNNQNKIVTTKQKVFRYLKTALKNVKTLACKTDNEMWQNDNICKDIYVKNLRKKPCFWVYKCCPSFYPYFLGFIRFNVNCIHCFLLMVSSCIWFPIIFCCYLCCSLITECI
ncbi:uncharacterized protein LOC124532631 [Vanessa cardui]|uniref:uncharacterized protein LOC124532631 n=1 Tax=Vanessa cardui TaxID=171605 RepID=UPI001F129740|nr:uncharacterized protein LOC124532631 [Vanessa cardui]